MVVSLTLALSNGTKPTSLISGVKMSLVELLAELGPFSGRD
jgi:hypothetical protein